MQEHGVSSDGTRSVSYTHLDVYKRQVQAGQALATVESNLSLTTYTVNAPISGVVLERNASVGSVASEGSALFEIGDLSSLWVDLHIFGSDAQHIQPGAVSYTHLDVYKRQSLYRRCFAC